MAKHDINWQTTDVQFLEALLLATGGQGRAQLQEVLLMADALEGVVLSLPEVEAALAKLVAAGFVSIQKNKLAPTAAFLKNYEELPQQEESKALLQLLRQGELTAEKLEMVQQQELKKYKLKNYYQQYLEQFG